MRIVGLLVLFAVFSGAASAGERADWETNDYSARAYLQLDFGGPSQRLGLRLNGVDLRSAAPSNRYVGDGFFSSLTVGQWIGLGFTALVFASVAADAVDSGGGGDAGGTGAGGS